MLFSQTAFAAMEKEGSEDDLRLQNARSVVGSAKTLTELLPEYNTTYESVSAGFSGADMNVLDLYDMVSFSSAYEKLFAFFKSVMYYTKSTESGSHTSTVVIIPSGLGHKDETYLYLIKGMRVSLQITEVS